MQARQLKGFTLIEMMITVAIAGILAAIAFPSYQEHVRKSRRAQAEADLTELAQFMERNYTTAGRYDKTSTGASVTNSTLSFKVSPRTASGSSVMYNIDFVASSLTTNAFTLKATRNSSSAQASDGCGDLTLTQAGTKGITSNASGKTASSCWQQ